MQKVSIITMTYNDCANLQKCITRILAQDYENIEYIIVDGGSTDGTLELIKETKDKLQDKMKWVSEPDNGLYDALNKGIKMATGDIIGIMCDEFAHPEIVSTIVKTIEETGSDGVHGDINYVHDGEIVRKWRMGNGNIRSGWMPGHPTLYLKRHVYDTYGLYKTDYKIAADYEFMIRILKNKQVKLAYISEVMVHMFHGDNSTSTGGLSNYIASLKEGHRALTENKVKFAFITDLCRVCRVVVSFLSRR